MSFETNSTTILDTSSYIPALDPTLPDVTIVEITVPDVITVDPTTLPDQTTVDSTTLPDVEQDTAPVAEVTPVDTSGSENSSKSYSYSLQDYLNQLTTPSTNFQHSKKKDDKFKSKSNHKNS